MKKLLLRLGSFFLSLWILLWAMDAILPYYWGNAGVAAKMDFLETRRDSFNVFFMGSSRVYRQISPKIFDANTNAKTRSFNLAYRGTFNPETYYLLENFIKKKASKTTFLVVELQSVRAIAERNLNAVRSTYFIDYEWFRFAEKIIEVDISLDEKTKKHRLKNYRKAFGKNIFKTSHAREMMLSLLGEGNRDMAALGLSNDGFQSLDTASKKGKDLLTRRAKFLDKIGDEMTRLEEEKKKYIQHKKQSLSQQEVHLKKIKTLIEASKKQGYTLIFVLPPKRSELLSLFSQIPENHRMNVINPATFPQLYEHRYWFDEQHLNEVGAVIFTKQLAVEFSRLNESDE